MVSDSTISRVLKGRRWSRKKARREAQAAHPQARADYIALTTGLRAENMVFLDESLFNETTGWRLTAWAPLGEYVRYAGDRTRGQSWSFLAAYSVHGYLPCWTVKEGYFPQ